ncbi:hypothetical protein RF11_03184 [Thelohanellus kitauei]|uniref:Uncharacterized protein n=1 Tax=Thelohanellus kitauei TaxID=669202 RepID=A0A0C2JCZ2_THEKT|nr:hypothetical protein RF11_03184 [Thelohanellus kitauei]
MNKYFAELGSICLCGLEKYLFLLLTSDYVPVGIIEFLFCDYLKANGAGYEEPNDVTPRYMIWEIEIFYILILIRHTKCKKEQKRVEEETIQDHIHALIRDLHADRNIQEEATENGTEIGTDDTVETEDRTDLVPMVTEGGRGLMAKDVEILVILDKFLCNILPNI